MKKSFMVFSAIFLLSIGVINAQTEVSSFYFSNWDNGWTRSIYFNITQKNFEEQKVVDLDSTQIVWNDSFLLQETNRLAKEFYFIYNHGELDWTSESFGGFPFLSISACYRFSEQNYCTVYLELPNVGVKNPKKNEYTQETIHYLKNIKKNFLVSRKVLLEKGGTFLLYFEGGDTVKKQFDFKKPRK